MIIIVYIYIYIPSMICICWIWRRPLLHNRNQFPIVCPCHSADQLPPEITVPLRLLGGRQMPRFRWLLRTWGVIEIDGVRSCLFAIQIWPAKLCYQGKPYVISLVSAMFWPFICFCPQVLHDGEEPRSVLLVCFLSPDVNDSDWLEIQTTVRCLQGFHVLA